jgi:hypothetical protein
MITRNKPLFVLISVILIIFATAFGGVYLIHTYEGLRLTINFSDAKGLYKDSPVEYKGIQIGSVLDIETDLRSNIPVLIKIDSEHSEHVRKNAVFVISSNISAANPPGILMGYCRDVDPQAFPKLPSGSVVDGEDSELVFMVKTRVGCFHQTTESFSKALENLKRSVDDVLNSPKAQQLYQDIENFFIELNKNMQERIEDFIEEKGPEIRKKIEELIKELEKLGHDEEAEKWKKFLKDELQKEI